MESCPEHLLFFASRRSGFASWFKMKTVLWFSYFPRFEKNTAHGGFRGLLGILKVATDIETGIKTDLMHVHTSISHLPHLQEWEILC
jgi:hypothetical protein